MLIALQANDRSSVKCSHCVQVLLRLVRRRKSRKREEGSGDLDRPLLAAENRALDHEITRAGWAFILQKPGRLVNSLYPNFPAQGAHSVKGGHSYAPIYIWHFCLRLDFFAGSISTVGVIRQRFWFNLARPIRGEVSVGYRGRARIEGPSDAREEMTCLSRCSKTA